MENIQQILDCKMCCGCGACASICPVKCIDFIDGEDVNYPKLDSAKCVDCKLCLKVCPGDKNKVRLLNNEKPQLDSHIKSIKVSYSTDDKTRMNASSGGIITELLAKLFDDEEIDSAVVVSQDKNKSIYNSIEIITSKEELGISQGSRYSPASNCTSIQEILKNDKYNKVAFVGKPCDIEAVATFQGINKKFNSKIKFKISIMCHHSPTRKVLRNFITNQGFDLNNIKTLKFRGDGWPGYFKVEDNNGKVYKTEYFNAWGNFLSKEEHVKCMYCENPFPQEADIIVGDPWGNEFKNDKKGQSLCIIRTQKVSDKIKELETSEKIKSIKVSYEDVKRYQVNLLKRNNEFYLTSLLYKKVHNEKIKLKDYKLVIKENPKNILRYVKNLEHFKEVYDKWEYK